MKRLLCFLAVVALVGCASNPQTKIEQTATPAKAQKFEGTTASSVELKVPSWYIQPPEATEKSIFSPGEASGPNLGMTMHKAMLDADSKLAFQMQSKIKSMAKSFKTDNGKYGAESSELLIRKITSVTVIGHQQVDSQITKEGNLYRVFVLMRYPVGEANRLLQDSIANDMQTKNAERSKAAMQELNDGLKGDETPQSQVKGVTVPESDAKSSDKTVSLFSVDNEEYKKKRDEALAKPGAVLGQVTVR